MAEPQILRILLQKPTLPPREPTLARIAVVSETNELVIGLIPTGYLRRDAFGRISFGSCKTEEEHLLAEPVGLSIDGAEPDVRRRCCVYLEDLFAHGVGKKVLLNAAVIMTEEEQ
jgi:hypothetical protein